MKNLVKISLVSIAVIAFASCQKTEFDSVTPVASEQNNQTFKYHGTVEDMGSGDLFTDKDKCKKCHTSTSRSMGLDWTAPYMSDNRYSSIEELIENFDFVNEIHLPVNSSKNNLQGISEKQKSDLITYLKNLQSEK
jgi:hypothetical protein